MFFGRWNAYVVVFDDTECPLANLYFPTVTDLHRDYADNGVQFLARAVHWGLQTWEEMQDEWMEVVWKKPDL